MEGRVSAGTIPARNHWNAAFTANTIKGERNRARGILIWGYFISSPIAQQVSNPAKHHHISATLPIKLLGEKSTKSGICTKFSRCTFGSMVINHIIATPQKKNMKPFCKRPVISTPRIFVKMNTMTAALAIATSLTGSSNPKARNRVLK